MFGSLDFDHYFYQGFNEIEELISKDKLRGIKLYTCYQKINLESERVKKIFDLADRYTLPVMFHIGYSFSSQRKYGKPSVEEMVAPGQLEHLARDYPEVDIIVSHLGKPYFKELVTLMKQYNNVHTDMSGLINSRYDREQIPWAIDGIRQVLGELGPQRLLFGTDFPVQTHEDSIYFIEQAMKDYSDFDKHLVYYHNAKTILAIYE